MIWLFDNSEETDEAYDGENEVGSDERTPKPSSQKAYSRSEKHYKRSDNTPHS